MELTKGFGTKTKHQISSHLGLGDDLGLHSWQASSKRKGELKHVGPKMLGFQLPMLQTGRGKGFFRVQSPKI